MRLRFAFLVCAALMSGPPLAAQTADEPQGESIVVEGSAEAYRRLENSIRTGFSTDTYRPDVTGRMFERSERAARCAARGRLTSLALLRGVVDGVFNSSQHDVQQNQLLVQTATCGEGAAAFRQASAPGAANGPSTVERGILLRGAVMIAALQLYAPGLTLTPETLHDPDVVRRFAAREEARARLRVAQDLNYFRVTTCLVQVEPEAAIAVVYGDAHARDLRLRIARMIDRGRQCVGGAGRVAFDPLQFRVYLADSLYRWAVAARNVESLIPRDAEG